MASRSARDALLLAVATALAATLFSLTLWLTREPIAAARERAAQARLLELVPDLARDSELTLERWPIPPHLHTGLGLEKPGFAYRVLEAAQVRAVIVPTVSTQGYGGPIRLLVGINRDGTITGVRVVEQRETPGIGDRILAEKSDWLQIFTGRSRDDPQASRWQVRSAGGAFDAIAGATVSSRAVIRQVRRALDYFADDRQQLLAPAAQPEETVSP
jgi:electron transport complex protein RnfG